MPEGSDFIFFLFFQTSGGNFFLRMFSLHAHFTTVVCSGKECKRCFWGQLHIACSKAFFESCVSLLPVGTRQTQETGSVGIHQSLSRLIENQTGKKKSCEDLTFWVYRKTPQKNKIKVRFCGAFGLCNSISACQEIFEWQHVDSWEVEIKGLCKTCCLNE